MRQRARTADFHRYVVVGCQSQQMWQSGKGLFRRWRDVRLRQAEVVDHEPCIWIAGRQLARFRIWPRVKAKGFALILSTAALSIAAWSDGSAAAATLLGAASALFCVRTLQECGWALIGLKSAAVRDRDQALAARAARAVNHLEADSSTAI